VAYSADLGFAVVEPEVAAICERAAAALVAACGATQVDARLALEDFTAIYAQVESVDRFVGIDPSLWQTRLEELDPRSAPAWTAQSRVTAPAAAEVEAARRALVAQVADLLVDVDLLVTPATCMAPFAAEGPMPNEVAGVRVHRGMSVVPSFLASLVNLPAISLPAGRTTAGLPVGLQVIGPRFREELVLAAAARFEAAHPWPRHHRVA
jgi:aspartyl-tRNA(Asn)/glutamyl-tRNA(Gln) amidotransferase subunit A